MRLPHLNFLASLLITPLFLLASSTVQAVDFKLIVSPPSASFTAQPGEVIQKTIKITNDSSEPQTISTNISDFIVQDDEGTPIKVTAPASGRYLASPWVTIAGDNITLAPQETIALPILIEVPKNALPGGHYAGIFFSPATVGKPDSTGASIRPEVGSLLAITIPGDINYDAQIISFTTTQPIFEFGPVDFTAIIQNQSDTHIAVAPSLMIRDMFGRELSAQSLTATNIFPFTSRTFETTWDQVWGFGRYSAELQAPYGESHVASRMLYFWIIPYRLIAAVLVVLLVLIAIIILVRRHRKHATDQRDQEIDQLKRRLIELENKP